MSEYENAKGTEKISSDKKDELVAFKEKLRTDITALMIISGCRVL